MGDREKNSFLVKDFRNGTASVKFNRKPKNLFNFHSYKPSGCSSDKGRNGEFGGRDE